MPRLPIVQPTRIKVEFCAMTVLLAASSPEGFAIAADGRRVSIKGEYMNDNAQKIWPAVSPGKFAIAYGWCGNTRLEGDTVCLDFPTVSRFVFSEISKGQSDAPMTNLLQNFVGGIHRRLRCFLEGIDPALSSVTLPETIAQVLLAGYIGSNPIQMIGTFSHRDGKVQSVDLRSYDPVANDFLLLSGSATLFRAFQGPGNTSLQIATSNAGRYAQDCVDNRDTVSDCASFGGYVHVANVTKDGFSWVIPPIAL